MVPPHCFLFPRFCGGCTLNGRKLLFVSCGNLPCNWQHLLPIVTTWCSVTLTGAKWRYLTIVDVSRFTRRLYVPVFGSDSLERGLLIQYCFNKKRTVPVPVTVPERRFRWFRFPVRPDPPNLAVLEKASEALKKRKGFSQNRTLKNLRKRKAKRPQKARKIAKRTKQGNQKKSKGWRVRAVSEKTVPIVLLVLVRFLGHPATEEIRRWGWGGLIWSSISQGHWTGGVPDLDSSVPICPFLSCFVLLCPFPILFRDFPVLPGFSRFVLFLSLGLTAPTRNSPKQSNVCNQCGPRMKKPGNPPCLETPCAGGRVKMEPFLPLAFFLVLSDCCLLWGQSLWWGQGWFCWAFPCFAGISGGFWLLEPKSTICPVRPPKRPFLHSKNAML